jgi:hypothetical protein
MLAACGDNGTSPVSAAHLDVSVKNVSAPYMTVQPDGSPVVMCDVTFHVVSNGTDGARWSRGLMRWYVGKDRSAPVDSSALTGEDLQAFFSAGDLPAGSAADGVFEISSGIPFGGTLDIAYMGTRDSREHHASASFTCGPESKPDAAPPTVAVRVVTPETEILEPGDTIVLRLTAASNVGLWRTLVGISGPCETHQIFNDQLLSSVVHDVKLVLPASCSLNAPITATGAALDALAIETDVSVPTTRFIVDRTPPTIRAWQDRPGNFGGAGTTELPEAGGEFFVGESVQLYATLRDNRAMRAIIWEIQPFGARDSLSLDGDSVRAFRFGIPIKSEWGSSFQLRLYVRDESGNTSPVLESAPGVFTVRPAANLPTTTVGGVPVNAGGHAMIHDARSDRLFVMYPDAARILVYSATTLALQQTIQLPSNSMDFDVAEGGDTLFAALAGFNPGLALVDLTGTTPRVESVDLGATNLGTVWAVRILAGGHVLVQADAPGRRLLELDRATLAIRDRTSEASSELGPRLPDRTMTWLHGSDATGSPCTRRFDALTDTFSACGPAIPTGILTTSSHGDVVLVDGSLYDSSFNRLRDVAFPNAAWAWRGKSVLSPDGTTVYRGYEHGVVRARASDGAILDLIPLPYAPDWLTISEDGATLFALEWPGYRYPATLRLSRISPR